MRRSGLALAVLAALGGGVAASLGGGEALVTVHVVVDRPRPEVDASHVVPWTVVRGLTAGDFEVLSDAERRPVQSVAADPVPLSLAVLFDLSAGTEVTVDWLLEPVEKGLVPALMPGDRVVFGRFGGGAFQVDEHFAGRASELLEAAHAALTLPPKTSPPVAGPAGEGVIPRSAHDPMLMVRGVNGAFALGGSPAWDAVVAAVTVLEPQPGRRAVLLVTDGRSTGNVHGLHDAIGRAHAAAVPVFAAGLGLDELVWQGAPSEAEGWKRGALASIPRALVRPAGPLELLASATGGAYAPVFGPEKGRPKRVDALTNRPRQERDAGEPFHAAKVNERAFKAFVGRMLAVYVNELHGAYAVTFSAPALDGRLHALEVRVRRAGLRARAPQRYLAHRPGIPVVRPDG